MAILRCNCGVLLNVPPGVQMARCPVCYAMVNCPNNNGYIVPAANQYNRYGYGYGNNYYANHYPTGYSYSYSQQPPRPSPQLVPPPVQGRKRAVLIGICYQGQKKSLKGSVNDVRRMSHLLVNRLGFPNESVLVLTEEEKYPYQMPTKHNIRMAFQWLIRGCQSGDSLVFHFTGHGSQVTDFSGDEKDGYDESLCPVDYETEGKILDDEINHTIVRPLPHGAKLHAIIDTCASGTFLDLPFTCRMNQQGYYAWEDNQISSIYKGTSGGTAICFSACDDNETSLDTTAFSSDGTMTGAMTYSFIQAVENERGVMTYGHLLNAIRTKIGEAQKLTHGPHPPPTSQVPQLSSSEMFEIHSKPFML